MTTELSTEEKRGRIVNYCMKRRADCDKRAHDAANIRKMNIYVKMGDSWVKKAKYILSEASESYIAKLYNDTFSDMEAIGSSKTEQMGSDKSND